jgi:translation initiation factor IF-3
MAEDSKSRTARASRTRSFVVVAAAVIAFSSLCAADAAAGAPGGPAPACAGRATPAPGAACTAGFQSSFVPGTGVALRPASCSPRPGYSIGRQIQQDGVRTIVSQYRGRGRGRGQLRRPPQNTGPPMNDKIPFPEMRVVVANPDGKDEMLGVMNKEEALARAEDLGMDLVVVSPDAKPPVCKIINYDKLRYENEKKEKAKRKNQTVQELKEVKLSYKIDTHDYEVRKRAAIKFLTKGDKVKASIRFKGREMAHRTLAETTLKRLQDDLKEIGAAERRPSMEGRVMAMIVNPLPDVVKAAEAKRKAAKAGKKGKGGDDKDEDEHDAEVEALIKAQEEESDADDDDELEDHIDYDIDELAQADVTAKIDEVCTSYPSSADTCK